MRRFLSLLGGIVTTLGSMFVVRWGLALSSPRADLRPLQDAAHDVRYYWHRRVSLFSRLRVRLTYELGIADARLRLLRYRIQRGDYADDIAEQLT